MFEAVTMSPAPRSSGNAWRVAALAVCLPGCISDADTFKSKPANSVEAGVSVSAPQPMSAPVQSDGSTPDPTKDDAAVLTPGQSAQGGDAAADTFVPPAQTVDGSTSANGDAGLTSLEPLRDAGRESIPPGDVPPDFVGVWQAVHGPSSSTPIGEFSETFTELSELSATLEITTEGRYRFVHATSGASGECETVTRLDESVGTAELAGDVLRLTPSSRRVTTMACGGRSDDTKRGEIVLVVSLTESRQTLGGMRSFVMSAEGYGNPLSLTSLFRQPSYVPEQPEPPEDFVRGVNGPFARLRGLWVGSATGTDLRFYDPETGEFFLPESNESSQRWLRLSSNQYETAVALQDTGGEGSCKLDLVYYERGDALFHVVEDVEGLGWHFEGHVSLIAIDSRLVVNVRDCGENDGVRRYELEPLTSYLSWVYKSPDLPPESFSLVCEFPRSEWQSLLCGAGTAAFVRQE